MDRWRTLLRFCLYCCGRISHTKQGDVACDRGIQGCAIIIAIPHDGMLDLVRQGTVQRLAPGEKAQGWTWLLLRNLTTSHHRMQIYASAREAMCDAKRMDTENFVSTARQ